MHEYTRVVWVNALSVYVLFYAGTTFSCAGIQRWKSVLFHCWAAFNLVGEIRRKALPPPPNNDICDVEDPPYPAPPSTISSWELKWHVQCGGPTLPYPHQSSAVESWSDMCNVEDPPYPTPNPSVISSWELHREQKHYTAVPAYWEPRGSASSGSWSISHEFIAFCIQHVHFLGNITKTDWLDVRSTLNGKCPQKCPLNMGVKMRVRWSPHRYKCIHVHACIIALINNIIYDNVISHTHRHASFVWKL